METIFGLCSLDFVANSLTAYKSSGSYVPLRSDAITTCADTGNTTSVSFANYLGGVSEALTHPRSLTTLPLSIQLHNLENGLQKRQDHFQTHRLISITTKSLRARSYTQVVLLVRVKYFPNLVLAEDFVNRTWLIFPKQSTVQPHE